jgi:alpha-L-arabinofuranosidase
MVLTPTYHVMEMYTVHHDAVRLPVETRSAVYIAGKDTLKAVSVSASRDRAGATHLTLVNIDAVREQPVAVRIDGGTFSSVSGRVLTSAKIQDHNTFEDPARVEPKEWKKATLEGPTLRVPMPPCSVVVLTLK